MADEFEDYDERHQFEMDVEALVFTSLTLTLEGIDRVEKQEIDGYVRHTDNDAKSQKLFISLRRAEYKKLRTAAVHLAMVGLVTRFHHWLVTIANSVRKEEDRTFDNNVKYEMEFLNRYFKCSTHKPGDFKKWVDVRDSIIHADSRAVWKQGKKTRHVQKRFREKTELCFKESDLREAFKQMLDAVGWHYSRYEDWYVAKHGTGIVFAGQPPPKS